VLVVERGGGAGEQGGLVEREAHALAGEDHAAAAPVVADDVALGAVQIVDVHDVHVWSPVRWRNGGADTGARVWLRTRAPPLMRRGTGWWVGRVRRPGPRWRWGSPLRDR